MAYKRKRSYRRSYPSRYTSGRRYGRYGGKWSRYRRTYGGPGFGPGRSIKRLGGFRKEKAEKKFVDTAYTLALDTAGGLGLVNGITQGDDFNERVGREVHMKSIQIDASVAPQDSTTFDSTMRFIVFIDKQANGAAPTGTDILASSSPQAFLNLNNKDRFIILFDKRFDMPAQDTATAGSKYTPPPRVKRIKLFKKLSTPITFLGTTNGIGSISTNSLYLLTLGDAPAADGYEMVVNTRIRFTDC